MLKFHRKDQIDIVDGGVPRPWLVVGWETTNSHRRLACIWAGGVCIGSWIWTWKGRAI